MTAVAKQDQASVPALAATPAVNIDADDVSLPRLYVGSGTSAHVQAGTARVGQIYAAAGRDDGEPVILFDPKGKDASKDGIVVHVLAVTKCKALWEDGSKERWNVNDPAAPQDAWREYEYTLCLPEVDPDIPFRITMTKSSLSTAKKINTVLARAAGAGPAYVSAFKLTVKENKNDKGTWFTPLASSAEATEAGIAASSVLAAQIGQPTELAMTAIEATATATAANDEPEI